MEQTNKKIPCKMRIQLLDSELRVISDRLVEQSIELVQGAKVKHTDPIKLEVILSSKNDIDSLKSYLDQLAGKLPIKETGTRGRPASSTTNNDISPREDIYGKVEDMIKGGQNQDEIIKYLRGLGFVFLLTEDLLTYFPEFPFRERDIKSPNQNGQYPESYQWLVRRIKKSKDPKSDKYDPQIIFGIKVFERGPKFVGYLYKQFKGKHKAKVPGKNALSFANFEMAKLPHYMVEMERLKWSTEMRSLMMSKDKKPSKFFLRWVPDIILPMSYKVKLEHLTDIQFNFK